jgi:hypothetical protein
MIQIIASDFEVKVVTQNDQNSLLAAQKNVFVHFVFLHQQQGYNEIKQFYVHRFELASCLFNAMSSEGTSESFPLAGGNIQVEKLDEAGDTSIAITYDQTTFTFSLTDSEFGNLLLGDVELISKIHSDASKKGFHKKMITAILDEFEENKTYPFSHDQLLVTAFELKILKTKKSWQQASEYYELLNYQYRDSDHIGSYMVDNLCSTLEMVVGKSECDCGHPSCFFDLLHKAYTSFFNEDQLLTDGNLDNEKVAFELNKVWKKLDSKQRAVLNYLDYVFGNTPLINLYLLTENADFEEYIYKMTFQDQPDSEDDAFVRRTINLVRFYLN